MESVQRRRDRGEEEIQQKRYALLENLYLLTGPDCERRISAAEITAELGDLADPNSFVARDLIRLGYIDMSADGSLCITGRGAAFIQRDAWRRRSIRE